MSNSFAASLIGLSNCLPKVSNTSCLGISANRRRRPARRSRALAGCEWLEMRTVLSASTPMADALLASPIDGCSNETPALISTETTGACAGATHENAAGSNSSCWIRVSQSHAGDGDVDHPLVLGRVYNGESAPPSARDLAFVSLYPDSGSGGEKGGTEDINIGVGELQECTISKSIDRASTKLAQYAINGNSLGPAEIHFVEVAGSEQDSGPMNYMQYKLDRCFVKSWSTSGDADDRPTEEVAFYYNKIAFAYSGGSRNW